MIVECTRGRIEFSQQSHGRFHTQPFVDPAMFPLFVGIHTIRVTPTNHAIAGGANDPMCFEIRNLQVRIKFIIDMTEIVWYFTCQELGESRFINEVS